MNDEEPTNRLKHGATAAARLLASAAEDEPTGDELGELDSRLSAQLAGGAGPSGASGLAKGWLVGTAAVVVVAGGGWWVLMTSPPKVDAVAPARPPALQARSEPQPEPEPTRQEPEPVVTTRSSVPAPPPPLKKPSAPPRATAEIEKPPADVTDELLLLERADAALRAGDAATALERIAEHERDFANGSFVQEREVLAVKALLEQGKTQQADQRASRFFNRFAGSVHVTRMRALMRDGG